MHKTMPMLLPGIGIALGILLLAGLIVLGRRWYVLRRRILWEDALKQLCAAKHESRSLTPLDIAGRLGLSPSAMQRLTQALESAGLVAGERLGQRILRGHRLWEHYLSGDVQVTLERLHDDAERAEHHLAAHEIDALADHLGHPRTDPHGDAIPTADGAVRLQQRTPLTDWPCGRLAVIVHVEDEPRRGLRAALRSGLRPGTVLRVVERDAESIVCEASAGRCRLSPAVAAGIDVRPAADSEKLGEIVPTLAGLPLGEQAEVVALAEPCTGLARRRLLDLGFTAGARVKAVLANLEDATHAYEIRGTVIALRREQAEQILVRPVAEHGREARHERRVPL
jgi:DtxR family Mn-dependent transcriptional regulator